VLPTVLHSSGLPSFLGVRYGAIPRTMCMSWAQACFNWKPVRSEALLRILEAAENKRSVAGCQEILPGFWSSSWASAKSEVTPHGPTTQSDRLLK